MNTEANLAVAVVETESAVSFDKVIGFLNDALRLFAEGNSEQGCVCLAEANSLLDSCLADGECEAEITSISVVSSMPSHPVEIEEALATIA